MVHSDSPVAEVVPHGDESVSLGCELVDLLLPSVINTRHSCSLSIAKGSVKADLGVDVSTSSVMLNVQLCLRSSVRVRLTSQVCALPSLIPGVLEAIAVCLLVHILDSQVVDVGVVVSVSSNSREEVDGTSDTSLLS